MNSNELDKVYLKKYSKTVELNFYFNRDERIEKYDYTNSVNPHNFDYLINPGYKICGENKGENLLLFAFVPISPQNFQQRLTIRLTWSNRSLFSRLRVIFLVGKSMDERVNEKLKIEDSLYGDIVQENFDDTYRNLTLKTIMGMKWVSKYCANVKYVLKIDDDVVLNTFNLTRYLDSLGSGVKNTFYCYLLPNKRANRIHKQSKFYVTYEEYPLEYYPPYCDGPAYVFTSDLAHSLYLKSLETPLFFLEDVYIGMLASKLNSTIINLKPAYLPKKQSLKLAMSNNLTNLTNSFYVNLVNSSQLFEIWRLIVQNLYNNLFDIDFS